MNKKRYSVLGRVVWSVGKFVAPKAYRRWQRKHEQAGATA